MEWTSLVVPIRDSWIETALSTDAADRSIAERSVRAIYRLHGFGEPGVLWRESPRATTLTVLQLEFAFDAAADLRWASAFARAFHRTAPALDAVARIRNALASELRADLGTADWNRVASHLAGELDVVGLYDGVHRGRFEETVAALAYIEAGFDAKGFLAECLRSLSDPRYTVRGDDPDRWECLLVAARSHFDGLGWRSTIATDPLQGVLYELLDRSPERRHTDWLLDNLLENRLITRYLDVLPRSCPPGAGPAPAQFHRRIRSRAGAPTVLHFLPRRRLPRPARTEVRLVEPAGPLVVARRAAHMRWLPVTRGVSLPTAISMTAGVSETLVA